MNLIGKIFVVAITLLSLLFMGLSMAVYSTHKNWVAAYDQQKTQLANSNARVAQLDSEMQLLRSNLERELAVAQQRSNQLQSELNAMLATNEEVQAEVNQLKQERRIANAAVVATQQNNAELANKNRGLQREVADAQEAADQSFDKVVRASSQLYDTRIKLASLEEHSGELIQQVADMTVVMRENGLNPAMRAGDVIPRVNGFVSGISRRAGAETIEVTIGHDDGLQRGHTVEVYRQNKYLGRAEILETGPDWATGRILPALKKGRIQEGDRVATRLNFG